MSIEIQCPSCKKRYRVEDRFAGKRVKCRNCAAAIAVPTADGLDELLEGIDEPSIDTGVDEEVGDETHEELPDEADVPEELPQGFGAALTAARSRSSNRRFALSGYPGAAMAHQYLPWIIGVICGGLSIYLGVQRVMQSPPPHGLLATMVGLSLLLYFVGVVPLTWRGLTSAAGMLRFDLPKGAGWRVMGLFSLPLLLAMMLSDSLGGVVAGIAVGVLMLMPLIWATFQLHWVEAVVAWMMTSLFFAGSAAAAGGLVFLVGLGIALSTDTNQPPPGEPVKVAVKPPATKPVDVSVILPPATRPSTPATQPGDLAIVPLPDLPPVPTLPTLPPPTPPNVFDGNPVKPPVAPTPSNPSLSEQPPAPKSDHVKIAPSPIVLSAKEIEGFAEGDQVLDADSATSPLAIRKRTPQMETIEVYKRDEDKVAGTVTFKRDPGNDERYIVSPSGDGLVRLVTWPKLGLQLWTTSDNHLAKIVDIDPVIWSASAVCFLASDQVLVHRWQNEHGMQVYSLRGSFKTRNFDIPPLGDRNYAVSSNGRVMAIATKENNTAQLHIYDLAAGRYLRKIPIPMDPRWPVTPVGMAFSPDSFKVAVLFEQEGNVLALAWNVASGFKTQEYVYTAGQLPIPPAGQFHGRAMDYLVDSNSWLLYGNLVIDAGTGKISHTLGIPTATSQRVVDARHVYLEAAAETGVPRLVHVEINPEALAKPRPTTMPATRP